MYVATAVMLSLVTKSWGQVSADSATKDSLAYAYGIVLSQGLVDYIEKQRGVDFDKWGEVFMQSLSEGTKIESGSSEHARMVGIEIGQQIGQQMMKQLNTTVFGDESTESLPIGRLVEGLKAALKKENTMTAEEAEKYANERTEMLKRENLMRIYGGNKAAGEAFLKKNAKKKGVKTLDGGVQYKVLVAGKGAIPAEGKDVKVHYEGRTLDGNVFDSSYERGEPVTLSPESVIKGWQTVLKQMPVGSTWEVYIPEDQAYGEQQAGEIEPFSMLIFKIELLDVVEEEEEYEEEVIDEVEDGEVEE